MIKILFLAANPMDTPRFRFDEEAHAIEAALRSAEYGERFRLVIQLAVRVSDIREILLREKPHVVHFSGHSSSANEIILQDEQGNPQPVSAAALVNLFSTLKDNLRCVVLSAGYTAIQGQSVAEQVDCVIGMSKEIGDTSAIEFSAAFYQALGSGRDVQTAFNLGCAQLDLKGLAGADVPQLFTNNIAANSITLASSAADGDHTNRGTTTPPRIPVEYHSCFISYSSHDQPFADRLHADLQARGVRCWFAPHDLKIGDRFRQRIDEAIHIYDKLLLILSEHSVASDWVTTEVEVAFEKERRHACQTALFPVRLDNAVMAADQAWAADIRRTRHIGDFTRWQDHNAYAVALDRLLHDLKAEPT